MEWIRHNGEMYFEDDIIKMIDDLRQRKWPEEKPEKDGEYLTRNKWGRLKLLNYYSGDAEFWTLLDVTHWLPIPPMGEEI